MDIAASVELVTEDSSPRRERESREDQQSGNSSSEQDDSGTEWIPQGQSYPLNSKRLRIVHLQRIAESMELPASGTAAVTRQLIEGKLMEMGKEPRNAQVVIQSENSAIYLIDENGIICVCEPREHVTTHETQPVDARREEPSTVRSALRDTGDELVELQRTLESQGQELRATLESLHTTQEALDAERRRCEQQNTELDEARSALEKEKRKVKRIWRDKCEQQLAHEEAIDEKDMEIARLKARLLALTSPASAPTSGGSVTREAEEETSIPSSSHRRGKAPPIDPFSAESPDEQWDDWLPTFERAAEWNGWTDSERLLQLAGHLRGKARQEFSLLSTDNKATFASATAVMRSRLDAGSRALAAQDFRHATQGSQEPVSDYILRLEKIFRRAYGREHMTEETRNTLLHGQLQEGLKYVLMKAPAVSGARDYQELCTAAKNEERRLSELNKRQQYFRDGVMEDAGGGHHRKHNRPVQARQPQGDSRFNHGKNPSNHTNSRDPPPSSTTTKRCYICDKAGHLAKNCDKARKTESTGNGQPSRANALPVTRQITAKNSENKNIADVEDSKKNETGEVPLEFLLSDSEEDDAVCQVRISDKGSESQCVRVLIQGVPSVGLVNTAADITIIGGDLFKKVASVARLKKRDFKLADKTPRTYDQRPFKVDGKMDLDISFGDMTMQTPVYIKMDAADQLLLSEGVCRQLGIVTYHDEVGKCKADRKREQRKAMVPAVSVSTVKTVHVLPHQSIVAEVGVPPSTGPLLLEHDCTLEESTGLQLEDTLIHPDKQGLAYTIFSNPTGCSSFVNAGTIIGRAVEVEIIEGTEPNSRMTKPEDGKSPTVRSVQLTSDRKRKLLDLINRSTLLNKKQTQELEDFISNHHAAFSLNDLERGETNLLDMEIHTGEETPRRVAARRMPFAVRQEVARQLCNMQEAGVIEPSSSPWSSPVVMVRKKDGTLRFCVDYRELNKITKRDTYPLPRVDDLLDQLGSSRYFTTLDLASGYWQIRVAPGSREKTAFVTPHGLFQFRVMPFGLTNAPAVFQRLMQTVLMGLNPVEGKQFVSVYIDDVLVFSQSLDEHLEHLRLVIQKIQDAGLKLKPAKCQFVREEVEYLGHVLTPSGLKTNLKLVESVVNYPRPQNSKEVKQFLGLSSYYRRFIQKFAAIAQPLTALTRNGVVFEWTEDCQAAFDRLKQSLTTAPVLCYPAFDLPFVLETDASIKGIGAILSQVQRDGQCHPVAYASRSLTAAERNYGITELETLAVVWSITHYHSYLYGHDVTVYTDHLAVQAILNTPSPSGKHARWWSKVYGAGIGKINIVHRSGKANINADALSRNPQAPAPKEGISEGELQVAAVSSEPITSTDVLLQAEDTNFIRRGAAEGSPSQEYHPFLEHR